MPTRTCGIRAAVLVRQAAPQQALRSVPVDHIRRSRSQAMPDLIQCLHRYCDCCFGLLYFSYPVALSLSALSLTSSIPADQGRAGASHRCTAGSCPVAGSVARIKRYMRYPQQADLTIGHHYTNFCCSSPPPPHLSSEPPPTISALLTDALEVSFAMTLEPMGPMALSKSPPSCQAHDKA